MTAANLARENRRLAARLGRVTRIERTSVLNFVQTLLLVAPLILLTGDGMLFFAGLLYGVAYTLLMLVPTALNVLTAFDALRVLFKRSPIFVPYLAALAEVSVATEGRETTASRILGLGVTGNPLMSLTRELWMVASRFNPGISHEVQKSARQIAKRFEGHSGITIRLVAKESRALSRSAGLELMTC